MTTGDPNNPGTGKPPTLTEITGIVSNQLRLPLDNPVVGQIGARIYTIIDNNPALAAAGPEGIKAVVWSITPEDPAKMDPARQAEERLHAGQEYYQETRKRGEQHKPGTGTKMDQFHGWMQDAFGNHRSVENAPQADREVDKQIRGASRPEGPSGRADYKPLQQPNAAPTKAERAAARMIASTQANVADTHAQNTDTVQASQRGDGDFAVADAGIDVLNGGSKPPEPKAAAKPSEPERPVQTAKNTKAAPSQPTT